MAGRDASPSRGGRAASQSPRPASSRSSTSSANLSASQRAAERTLKEDLAAWRERREHHRLQQKQPKTPPQPRPFSLISTSGPSDEEKHLILQRRRELMRSPSKQPPPGTSLPVQPRRNSKEDSTASKIPGGSPLAMRADTAASGAQAKPPPRTPPPRKTGQNGPRPSTRPPPPQTPPLAPRLPPSRISGPRASHGQRRERLPSEPANAPVATDFFDTPLVPLMALSTEAQLSAEQPQQQREVTSPEPEDAFAPLREPPPSSPPVVNQPRPTTFEAGQQWIHPESDGDTVASAEPSVVETKSPSVSSLLQSVPMTPPRCTDSKNERGASSLTPVSGSLQASPGKQVRFAEDQTVGRQDRGEGGQISSDDNSMVHGAAHYSSDDELTDSQSSRGREMMEREQLLSEVDELIHQRSEEVIVTDHLVHRHTAADGHEQIEEKVSRNRAEKSSVEHVVEEKTPHGRLPDEDISAVAGAMDDSGVCRDLSSLVGHHMEANPIEDSSSANGNDGEVGVRNGENADSESGVRLRVVKSRFAGARSEESSLPTQPLASVADRRMSHLRNAMVVTSLIVVGAVAFCLLYPQSPMSRTIRETKDMSLGMASYFGTRATVWLWHTIIHPASAIISKILISSNSWLTPLAEAMRSLVNNGWQELLTLRDRVKGSVLKVPEIGNLFSEVGPMFVRSAKSVFSRISSRIADAILYVSSSLMQPLPSIDPEAAMAVHNRLHHLTEVQSQLRVKVKDLLRTQEEWALEELERMKQRRVAHATATQSIMTETTKMMLQVVEEAKLSAAEHVQDFTKQLAQELMSSIKLELDEYKREEVELSHDQAQHETALKRMKLEEAARLEILRVESAKRQAAVALQDEGSKDRKSLLQEKVFIEVDVMEVIETVEDALEDAVDMSANTIADSLQETIDDVKAVAEVTEAELEAVVGATEDVIERAEKHFIEETVASIAEREQQLKFEHDVAEAEIDRLTGEEVKRLQQERKAAEELARATLLAEEALIREAEEARRALDNQLEAGKMELEQELVDAASVAVNVEVVEVEKIVVEEEVIKEVIETEIIDEIERLVHDVEQVESEAVQEVERIEAELAEFEDAVESTLDRLALEEVEQLKREQTAAEAKLSAVAFETEQQIASSAGVQLPQQHGHLDPNVNAVGVPASSRLNATAPALRSIVEEAERRHMVMLSVGFVVLGLATAFVLFPRWRRLVANPSRETKTMSSWGRRRRRRSWQRPAQASESEPEEVVLLQTGSSSEDELFATNEPEPEVIELMSGTDSATTTPRSTFTRTSRTTISSYSRTLDFTGGDEREDSQDGEEEEPARPPSRALRRRRR